MPMRIMVSCFLVLLATAGSAADIAATGSGLGAVLSSTTNVPLSMAANSQQYLLNLSTRTANYDNLRAFVNRKNADLDWLGAEWYFGRYVDFTNMHQLVWGKDVNGSNLRIGRGYPATSDLVINGAGDVVIGSDVNSGEKFRVGGSIRCDAVNGYGTGASPIFSSLGVSLPSASNALQYHLNLNTMSGNADSLRAFVRRKSPGSDWTTAEWYLGRYIDVTNQHQLVWGIGNKGATFKVGRGYPASSDFLIDGDGSAIFSGNVGIGVANPGTKLMVAGTASLLRTDTVIEGGQLDFSRASDDTRSWSLDVYGDNFRIFGAGGAVADVNPFTFRQDGSFTVAGNVGIGVANPGTKLVVAGTASLLRTDTVLEGGQLDFSRASDNARSWSLDVYGDNFRIIGAGGAAAYANPFTFRQDGSFTVAGNVGIGVANPTSRLAVAGVISASEVRVVASPADYVFADDYKLRPLSEVEAHVKERRHLPGYPSAAEQEKAGQVSLGELQRMQLEKIEELTLYAICADKRQAQSDKRLAEAEAQVLVMERRFREQQAQIDALMRAVGKGAGAQ